MGTAFLSSSSPVMLPPFGRSTPAASVLGMPGVDHDHGPARRPVSRRRIRAASARETRPAGNVETDPGLTHNGANQAMASHDYKVALDPKPGCDGFALMVLLAATGIDDAAIQARERYPRHDVSAAPVRMN